MGILDWLFGRSKPFLTKGYIDFTGTYQETLPYYALGMQNIYGTTSYYALMHQQMAMDPDMYAKLFPLKPQPVWDGKIWYPLPLDKPTWNGVIWYPLQEEPKP